MRLVEIRKGNDVVVWLRELLTGDGTQTVNNLVVRRVVYPAG
jgi:hypothetical protein